MSSSSSSSSSEEYSSSSSSHSSRSSSSSSSSNSSSSSSSSSLDSSSSSSKSSYSSSSSSSLDSSSSSSIDSSSSSSSSSLDERWNFVKPLIFGHSSINGGTVYNRVAQTIFVNNSDFDIKKVYCYLYGKYGQDLSFDINLSVYTCFDDGTPDTLIQTSTINSSSVTGNDWYEFLFTIEGISLSNNMLSIVMQQDGGDENNYVLWGYVDAVDGSNIKSFISKDAITWEYIENIMFGVRVIEDFSKMFDLINNKVNIEHSQKQIFPSDLEVNNSSAIYKNTFFSNTYGDSYVAISNPKLFVSFIMDSSGSMGWNDRFSNRIDFANTFTNHLKDNYSGDVVFDVVKFGANQLDPNVVSHSGVAMTINLDARSPSRSVYVFTLAEMATVEKDAIYIHNGESYTVTKSETDVTQISCSSNVAPLESGTLVKTTEEAIETLTFLSYRTVTVDNSTFVAYGFKNLTSGHTYNISSIQVDSKDIVDLSSLNWKMFYPSDEFPSISLGENGPENTESVDIIPSENFVLRNQFTTREYLYSALSNGVSKGDTSIVVGDESIFSINQKIDIVGAEAFSFAHTVANVINSVSTVVIDPASTSDFGNIDVENGMIQESSIYNTFSFLGTTIMLRVRDVDAANNNPSTFFLQTSEGFTIEWDFVPFTEWYIYNFNWLGDTAIFPINLKDKDGENLPDLTEIQMEVDEKAVANVSSIVSQNIIEVANVGASTVYVSSLVGFELDMEINLVDSVNYQVGTIKELGTENSKFYIKLYDALQFVFDPANGAKVVIPKVQNTSSVVNAKVSSNLSLVNVTPIWAKRALDPSYLAPYDPPQVDPSTSYSDLNLAKDYIRNSVQDIPSIDGAAVIRVLPITEDVLQSKAEKDAELQRLMVLSPPKKYGDQSEQNDGDFSSIKNTFVAPNQYLVGKDFAIETPVFLEDGYVESTMTSSSTEFSQTTLRGFVLPNTDNSNGIAMSNSTTNIYAKKYLVYPSVIAKNQIGTPIARQYLNEVPTYFSPPYNIYSSANQYVIYWKPVWDGDPCQQVLLGYESFGVYGTYVGSGDSFTLNYTVCDKFSLMKNGILKVRVYTNNVIDMEPAAATGNSKNIKTTSFGYAQPPSEAFLNSKLNNVTPTETPVTNPQNGQTTMVYTGYSDIDLWRKKVENNPYSQSLSDPSITNENDPIENISFGFYQNPEEWILAKHLSFYEKDLTVINGHATLVLPPTDVQSVLYVEAYISFGNDKFEAIRGDMVFMANPIQINPIDPMFITPEGDSITYEIGNSLTWMNGRNGIIEDGITVSYSGKTAANPTVSVSDNGYAAGIFLGPKNEYFLNPDSEGDCEVQQLEKITIKAVSKTTGYAYTCKRLIAWLPIDSARSTAKKFLFKCTSSSDIWADGGIDATSCVQSDLYDGVNQYILGGTDPSYWVGEDGISRLLGYEQSLKLPRDVKVTQSNSPVINLKDNWGTDGKVSFYSLPKNENIGHTQLPSVKGNIPAPWFNGVNLVTTYKDADKNIYSGYGSISPPLVDEESGKVYWNKPSIVYKEPLDVTISIEALNGTYIRDEVCSPNIVVDVTWKGEYLKKSFTYNPGTQQEATIEYPFPTASFKLGFCKKVNRGGTEEAPQYLDTRCIFDGCLEIEDYSKIKLSNYEVKVGLFRTTIYPLTNNPYVEGDLNIYHTHACIVDDNGNGETTETILLNSETPNDHKHVISNYVVNTQDGHTHGLRSVAITKLLPTLDLTGFSINGYVPYDPTGIIPPKKSTTVAPTNPKSYTYPEGINRVMWSTLNFSGYSVKVPEMTFKVSVKSNLLNSSINDIFEGVANTTSTNTDTDTISEIKSNVTTDIFYTAETPIDTVRGFDIGVQAIISEEIKEISPGVFVTIPEHPVPDGTRFMFEIETFKPPVDSTSGNQDMLIMSPDSIRQYMLLKLKITATIGDETKIRSFSIPIGSILQWIPGVNGLLDEPTSNASIVSNSFSKIHTVGSSQIYDAVFTSASRIIDFQTSNSVYENYNKIIVLLTDGDENMSTHSLEQATKSINSIYGNSKPTFIILKLGNGYISDDAMLLKMKENIADSIIKNMVDLDQSSIDEIINSICVNALVYSNEGSYFVSFRTDTLSVSSTASLSLDSIIPANSHILFRIRTSVDGVNWSSWSEWGNGNIDQIPSLYFEYEIKLIGNENFESPKVKEGLIWEYLRPSETTVFFNPQNISLSDDEYVSSALFTQMGDYDDSVVIDYGITQSNSTNIEDYYIGNNLMRSEKQEVLLSRYNEPLTTKNYKTYLAQNGGWCKDFEIEVYRYNDSMSNGVLVDSSLYTANPFDGKISFLSQQNKRDAFMLCVKMDAIFRFVCKITNYKQESFSIDHIGLIYNIMKRVPRDENGTIIHKTIDNRM
jgi:hypothetical protein